MCLVSIACIFQALHDSCKKIKNRSKKKAKLCGVENRPTLSAPHFTLHNDRFSKSQFSDGSVGCTECFNNIEFEEKYMPNKSVEVRCITRFWVCCKCTSVRVSVRVSVSYALSTIKKGPWLNEFSNGKKIEKCFFDFFSSAEKQIFSIFAGDRLRKLK